MSKGMSINDVHERGWMDGHAKEVGTPLCFFNAILQVIRSKEKLRPGDGCMVKNIEVFMDVICGRSLNSDYCI